MAGETTAAQMAARVQRFRFASFDEEEPLPQAIETKAVEKINILPAEPAPPPPPPPPTFTEKDLQVAKSEGHAQGLSEGYASAEAKLKKEAAAREEATRALLDVIANRITIAAESHAGYIKGQEETMGKLVMAIARKLSGEALKSEPYANVESLLHECMGLIAGAPKIVIVVAPTRSVDLKRRMDTLKPRLQGFEGELLVEEDAALGEQDCRVEWKDGYGERSTEALWKSIETIVAQKTINAKESA